MVQISSSSCYYHEKKNPSDSRCTAETIDYYTKNKKKIKRNKKPSNDTKITPSLIFITINYSSSLYSRNVCTSRRS